MPAPFDVYISPTKTIIAELRRTNMKSTAVNFACSLFLIAALALPTFFGKIPAPLTLPLLLFLLAAIFIFLFIIATHSMARLIGGKEKLRKLAHVTSVIAFPFSFLFMIFSSIGLYFLSILLLFYTIYIAIVAVGKCYDFGIFKSTAVTFLSGAVAVFVTIAIANVAFVPFLIDVYNWFGRIMLIRENPEVTYSLTKNEFRLEVSNARNESERIAVIGKRISINETIGPLETKNFTFGIECIDTFEETIRIVRGEEEMEILLVAKCPR